MVLVLDKYTKELEMLGKGIYTTKYSKVVLNYNKYKSMVLLKQNRNLETEIYGSIKKMFFSNWW